jgi:GTPase
LPYLIARGRSDGLLPHGSIVCSENTLEYNFSSHFWSLMSFTIAIIGRPNVGKSTLFNRLVGQKLALVDDAPGVTRDRREGEARLGDLRFTVIDTAGLDEGAKGSLTARMQEQTETAIGLADALMFVIDARAGLTPSDRAFADYARRANKPVILLANKSEGKHGEIGAMESYALGLGDPVQISAEHGEGIGELYDALRALMPEPVEEDEESDEEIAETDEELARRPIRVAVVGRPNAGKSTLINRLLGEERLLTSAEAGTTRDSIAVEITWNGRDFRVFDTAGLRRRSRIEEKLEKLSVADALRAVRFAEVVVLMMDAQNKFEEQDLRIADLIEREGRALVIAVNKWDLMETKGGAISALRTEADHLLPQVKGAPLVAVSGLMGEGIDRLMRAIEDAYAVWNRRVPTAALNRWFEQAVDANPPPAVSGRRLKLNYITQAKARPPSFVLFCSRADAVPQSYLRYLVNSLREYFELPGTPVRISLREKANPFAHKRKRPS